jgi:hypothetical protein
MEFSGEILDQSRPAHPRISMDPQRITVKNRNHRRYLMAWPTCTTILPSISRYDIDGQLEDVQVERLNSATKTIATASDGIYPYIAVGSWLESGEVPLLADILRRYEKESGRR